MPEQYCRFLKEIQSGPFCFEHNKHQTGAPYGDNLVGLFVYTGITRNNDIAPILGKSINPRRIRELRRVVKPGGTIRLMEYVRPRGMTRRLISYLWQPWIAWAYGASFDRHTEQQVPAAGLELIESRYVVDDLMKLLTLRVAAA